MPPPNASRALDAANYDALTFDCYGTLIDWGQGLIDFLQPVLLERDAHVIDDFLLEFFAAAEPQAQVPGRRYADVLREVLRQLGQRLGFTPDAALLDAFAASPGDWQAFPDTVEALRRLAARFDLAVVSNIDNALFARTARTLGVEFKHVVTAEAVGVYKPDERMFDAALAALGTGTRVLHVAQSLFHDIAPAAAKGLDTVWIRRPSNAAKRIAAKPTWAFDSLGEFADAMLGPAADADADQGTSR